MKGQLGNASEYNSTGMLAIVRRTVFAAAPVVVSVAVSTMIWHSITRQGGANPARLPSQPAATSLGEDITAG